MLIFSKEKVYSAPIRVGSLPPWIEKLSVGAILTNPWGNHPHKFPAGELDPKVARAADAYGTPKSGTE